MARQFSLTIPGDCGRSSHCQWERSLSPSVSLRVRRLFSWYSVGPGPCTAVCRAASNLSRSPTDPSCFLSLSPHWLSLARADSRSTNEEIEASTGILSARGCPTEWQPVIKLLRKVQSACSENWGTTPLGRTKSEPTESPASPDCH